jgi:hypothetical protein
MPRLGCWQQGNLGRRQRGRLFHTDAYDKYNCWRRKRHEAVKLPSPVAERTCRREVKGA